MNASALLVVAVVVILVNIISDRKAIQVSRRARQRSGSSGNSEKKRTWKRFQGVTAGSSR
jgi:hypothetical protein